MTKLKFWKTIWQKGIFLYFFLVKRGFKRGSNTSRKFWRTLPYQSDSEPKGTFAKWKIRQQHFNLAHLKPYLWTGISIILLILPCPSVHGLGPLWRCGLSQKSKTILLYAAQRTENNPKLKLPVMLLHIKQEREEFEDRKKLSMLWRRDLNIFKGVMKMHHPINGH